MAPTCCGKKFVPFGAGFGISFSQTRASHKKPHGSGGERVTSVDETTFVASSCLHFFLDATSTNRSVVLKFGIIQGLFGHFYTLTEFLRLLMCIIQI